MRLLAALAGLALAAAAPATAAPFEAVLSAPTHTPKVNTNWYYTIRVTRNGKAIRALLTVQIVDPFGGVHPVTYDNTKTPIVNRPIRGAFRDYNEYPADSRGFKLTFKATVKALGAKVVLRYWIKAR